MRELDERKSMEIVDVDDANTVRSGEFSLWSLVRGELTRYVNGK